MNDPIEVPDECRHVAVNPEGHHLSIEYGPVPTPGPGEVLIKVGAAGINRADLLQRKGQRVKAKLKTAAKARETAVENH